MSVLAPSRPPVRDAAGRAHARETLWRLSALAFAHPAPELHAALAEGAFHEAFGDAWSALTGRAWPQPAPPGDFAGFEAGYIAAFLHGPGGKPVASLLAGDHESLLDGLPRPTFMLNVAAFYRHFGLRAAEEGRADEPDHLASMMEFAALLAHLEARALEQGRDAGPARRAQRDFLARHLAPMLGCVHAALRRRPVPDLDPTLARLIEELGPWARAQIAELETRVGPYRDPDAPKQPSAAGAAQNLWG
jgi:DMSO reductase family type II enzyme chaperone